MANRSAGGERIELSRWEWYLAMSLGMAMGGIVANVMHWAWQAVCLLAVVTFLLNLASEAAVKKWGNR